MRDFVLGCKLAGMVRAPVLVLTAAAACGSPTFQAWEDEQAQYASMGDASSGATDGGQGKDGSDASGGASVDPVDSMDTTDAADVTGGSETTGDPDATASTGTTDGTEPEGPIGDAEKPRIVAVDLPDVVHAAGPVPLTVQTEHTAVVRVRLDGVDAGELVSLGEGVFAGDLPVYGAVDNGSHEVEIIAKQGNHQVTHPDSFEVATPKPGTTAWSFTGPTGSRTNRIAGTPGGDLIEVGQLEVNGIPRPSIRKRSGLTGAELWPEKTIVLDTLEGAVVDVAVLPDGRMWVAMNVHAPNKDPRPRLTLLDAAGHSLGVDVFGDFGRVVRAIAADTEGGCFAAGLAAVQGDWDIAYWRVNSAGVLSLADTYDFNPAGAEFHSFSEFATDVLIDGDLVWIVGASTGKHDKILKHTRGVIVPMALNTGEVITADVIVAPKADDWQHSVFYGGTLDVDGNLFVTGYGRDAKNNKHRLETSRYAPGGQRTWHTFGEEQSALTYGSDVALDSQGRVHVAGALTQDGVLHGYVFARSIGNGAVLFEQWFPGNGASEALGMLVNTYDRIVPAGYITTNGAIAARIVLIHG